MERGLRGGAARQRARRYLNNVMTMHRPTATEHYESSYELLSILALPRDHSGCT